MFVVNNKNLFFILSGTLILISIVAAIFFGFNFSIDFTGGALTQVTYTDARPAQTQVQSALDKLSIGDYEIQSSGSKDFILRTEALTNVQKDQVFSALSLSSSSPLTVDSYNSVGPTVGNELKSKAYTAIIVVIICIVLFVTFAFRKVSEPVPSWKYGLATIIALAHDVIIPTGVFIIFIHFSGGQIDVLFVSALLAILGYSVHDTIVVFDRIREHLRLNKENRVREEFNTTVGKSVSETFGRSINTSLTIFLVLLVLVILGSPTTRDFTIVLLVGVIVGTYSSIFVASPLLVVFEKWQKEK